MAEDKEVDKEKQTPVGADGSDKQTLPPTGQGEVDTSGLSKDAKKVLEMVEKMTILELNDLVKVMEDKFGVSAAPMAMAAAPGAAGEGAEAIEEKSQYDVELTETGANKIAVIKAVREINSDLGLKDAKDLVESAPKMVAEGAKKEEAEEAKKKLEDAGAKVALK